MIRRSVEEWQILFAQQAASGVSAQQFCKAKGLCSKHFSLRKKQLVGHALGSDVFVPVRVTKKIRQPTLVKTPASGLVLRQGSCSLYFDVAPAAEWLAQLVKALA
jgi:hypothetical protein